MKDGASTVVESEKGATAPFSPSNGSANFVRLFKAQFAPKVLSGEKCQTIRPTPKRMPKRGDTLSLRIWTGKPYRSKQKVLKTVVVTGVQNISIQLFDTMIIDGWRLPRFNQDVFARADGFIDADDMRLWFGATHSLPFDGIVIYWQND